jgi:hypothetical protein
MLGTLVFALLQAYPESLCRRVKELSIPARLLEMYREAGESYSRLEKKFGESWKEHRENIRSMIMAGAEGTRERGKVLILGVGAIEPLEYLARNFEQVEMVNLDYSTLEKVKGNLPEEPKSKVEIKQEDVTGLVARFLNQAIRIIEESKTPGQAEREILELMQDIQLPANNILGEQKWDYLVVSLVLSQLMSNELRFIESLLEDKFTLEVMAGFFSSRKWKQAKREFKAKVVDSLLERFTKALKPGGRIYLADTIRKKSVRINREGKLEEYREEKMFWVENLRQLVGNRFSVSREANWVWKMAPPQELGGKGIFYQVEAMLLGLPE